MADFMYDEEAFSLYCRYSVSHDRLSFSRMGKNAFTLDGFNTWKKALEKFKAHSNCSAHREALMRWKSLGKPSIAEKLSSDTHQLQASWRQALLKQLLAILYLARQGIALCGHSDIEGNLMQLLVTWAKDCAELKRWLQEKVSFS